MATHSGQVSCPSTTLCGAVGSTITASTHYRATASTHIKGESMLTGVGAELPAQALPDRDQPEAKNGGELHAQILPTR